MQRHRLSLTAGLKTKGPVGRHPGPTYALESGLAVQTCSDARVPGKASVQSRGRQTVTNVLQALGNRDPRDVLHALVAQLPRDLHAKGSAEGLRQVIAIHFLGK